MLMIQRSFASTANRLDRVARRHLPGRGLVAAITQWSERRRSRHALARLDERLLRDIGLTPGEAVEEAAVPFWKP